MPDSCAEGMNLGPGSDGGDRAAAISSSLALIPLFEPLSAPERAALAPLFTAQSFAREAVLFREGEPPRWLFAIVAGHVKQVKHADDGRDVILHVAGPGDVIGGVAAFGRRPQTFTAQAMAATEALRVAGPDFAAIMARFPAVARRTVEDLSARLIDAHETMKSLVVEHVDQRIARQLLKLADQAGRRTPAGAIIDLPLSRQDVADLAGTTVETAIRVLSRWRREGVVVTVDGRLVVVDHGALAAVAGGA